MTLSRRLLSIYTVISINIIITMASADMNSSYTAELLGLHFTEPATPTSLESQMTTDPQDMGIGSVSTNGHKLLGTDTEIPLELTNGVNGNLEEGKIDYNVQASLADECPVVVSPITALERLMSLDKEEDVHKNNSHDNAKVEDQVPLLRDHEVIFKDMAAVKSADVAAHVSDESESETEQRQPTQQQKSSRKMQEDQQTFAKW